MTRPNFVFPILLVLFLGQPLTAQPTDDAKAAVASRVASYVAAFNRRDVTACTEHWSKSAEYIVNGTAKPVVGRKAIGEALEQLLSTDEQFEFTVNHQRFRAVSDSVVIEEGVARLESETHGIEYAHYLVVHVKQNGTWYRDSIRETHIGTLSASAPDSEELESLVGRWIHTSKEITLTVQSSWTHNRRFITRNFELKDKNGNKTTATEIIGWDPAAGVLRSWSFDSQGGFEQAVWNRDGDQWLIKVDAVLPDGSTATEQRMLAVDSDGKLRSRIIEQQFGGRLLPGSEAITLVRDTAEQVSNK